MKKTQPYPNSEFKSVDEYVDFSRLYGVYGADAYEIKKKLDKRAKILEPTIRAFEKRLGPDPLGEKK